jgi:hypothetical protein
MVSAVIHLSIMGETLGVSAANRQGGKQKKKRNFIFVQTTIRTKYTPWGIIGIVKVMNGSQPGTAQPAKPLKSRSCRFSLPGATVLLSVAAAAANYAVSNIAGVSGFLNSGLYLDTIFTIAATFSGGLPAGILTALVFTASCDYTFWGFYLFGICSVAAAALTCVFIRAFPAECRKLRLIGRLPDGNFRESEIPPTPLSILTMLTLLSLTMCALISVLGGLIAWFVQAVLRVLLYDSPPETYFKLGLLKQNMNLLVTEILARFPVNILDRIISVFIAYGAARLLAWLNGVGRFLARFARRRPTPR